MKAFKKIISLLTLAAGFFLLFYTGCEYDVAEPQWYDEEFPIPGKVPKITSIEPSAVVPGVNKITITGENLDVVPNDRILLDAVGNNGFQPEIESKTSTSIIIRRPNLVTDSCSVKLVPDSGVVVKFGKLKVDQVYWEYGNFLDNLELSTLTVDANENLYAIEAASFKIYKISDGNKILVDTAKQKPTESRFGPDGNLYMLTDSRKIDKYDLTAGTVTEWTQLPQGRLVKFGDFDEVNLYAGKIGANGLLIIPFNNPANVTLSGYYKNEELLFIRKYGSFLYVVSRTGSRPAKIWRHPVSGGTLGAPEPVFDMSSDSTFSSRLVTAVIPSSDGKMFITTDSPNPLLILDLNTSTLDYFYKEIVPSYCKYSCWGNGNFLYFISGNTTPAQRWDVFRADMGITAAQ